MWYMYLRRDQQYLRSYRTHNLWLNHYQLKMRAPKVNLIHIAFLKRMAKSVSGVSTKLFSSSLSATRPPTDVSMGLGWPR
jgi:hypothetical protein